MSNASIVEVNPSMHSDLFQALKGGNNNFGIVTRFDIATFEQGLIWAGTLYHPLSVVDDIISEFMEITSPDAYDEYASFVTSFGYSQAQNLSLVTNQLEYTKDVGSPPVYQGFLSLPNLRNTSQLMNMTSLAKATQALQLDHPRYISEVHFRIEF